MTGYFIYKLENKSKRKTSAALTYVFPSDGANVVDVLDLPPMLDHTHGDGIVTNLWGDVAVDLEAQVSEHQVSCRGVERFQVIKGWDTFHTGVRAKRSELLYIEMDRKMVTNVVLNMFKNKKLTTEIKS